MGMGYAGSFAMTIEDSTVKKIVGKRIWDKYVATREACSEVADENQIMQDGFDLDEEGFTDAEKALIETFIKAYRNVTGTFGKKQGMSIARNSHSAEEDGSRYDDVDGCFWELDFNDCYRESVAMKRLNDVAKKCKDEVKMSHYVQFG